MTARVLDWLELCEVAGRRNPPERVIQVATVPAQVKKSRMTDCGFEVRSPDDAELPWMLRTERELVLLRALVDAGQVTIEDPAPAVAVPADQAAGHVAPGGVTPPGFTFTVVRTDAGEYAMRPEDLR